MADQQLPMVPGETPPAVVPKDPMELMALAVQQQDGATLEKTSAVVLEWMDRQARQEFHAALAAFQDECPPLPKTETAGKDGNYTYKYASAEKILPVLRPHLRAHGFSLSFDTERSEGGITTICELAHVGGHSKRARFTCPPDSGKMNAIQKVGSAQSYGMRYSLLGVLGLTTCSDDDAQSVYEGAGGDVPTITAEQALDIQARVESLWGADMVPKWIKWAGGVSFETIPADRYEEIVAHLRKEEGA